MHAAAAMCPNVRRLRGEVRRIARQLRLTCVRPDQGERVRTPKGSLRYLSCRQAFAWCGATHEPLIEADGLTREDWVRKQTKALQHLCKRSVKNSLVPPRGKEALAAMDDAETQQYTHEDEHRHELNRMC